MNTNQKKLRPNPRYSAQQRAEYFKNARPLDRRESVPLDKLQFAVDGNRDGIVTKGEWVKDASEVTCGDQGLYLGKKPGFLGSILGKKPKFQKASGWIEVPASGAVGYETKLLNSIDVANQKAEIATVYTQPYLEAPLFIVE